MERVQHVAHPVRGVAPTVGLEITEHIPGEDAIRPILDGRDASDVAEAQKALDVFPDGCQCYNEGVYRQCLMRRLRTWQVAWIPRDFARVGRFLELRGENGWEVMAAWSLKSAEYLSFNERDHRSDFPSIC